MLSAFFEAAPRAKYTQRVLAILFMLSSAFTGSTVHAQPVLTFDQALRLAQDRSRQLAAQDYAAAAAREMAVASAQLPDPTLTAGINNLPINGPDRFSLTRDFMTMRSVGLMQQFTRSDKRDARAARFDREAEAAESGRALALANLQRDTALAWLDRYYQERVREIVAAQRDEARLQIDAADAAYRSGRGSQADVFSARAAVAQIEDRIAQADRQGATAKSRPARSVGDASNLPLAAAPNVDVFRVDWTRLEDHITHHPQIELLLRQEQVARAEAEIAQTNNVRLARADVHQRGPAYSYMISVNFSLPCPLIARIGKTASWERTVGGRSDSIASRISPRDHVRYVAPGCAMASNRDRLAAITAPSPLSG